MKLNPSHVPCAVVLAPSRFMHSTSPFLSLHLSSAGYQQFLSCKNTMTQSHNIAKKWSRRGNVLRAIIHSKLFAADAHHNNGDHHACNEEDDGKQSFVVGLLPSLVRVPSRGLKGLRKLGRVVSMRLDEGREPEDGRVELCKLRIIMGKKCKPLHVSGALHYDKHGVLVPEDILSPSHD